MNSPLPSPKKRRQLLLVIPMLLAMGSIILFLFLHTERSGSSSGSPGDSNSNWSWSFDKQWSFSLGGDTLRGAGGTASETRKLDMYSAIEANGLVNVTWSPGPESTAVVKADQNLLRHIKTEVVDGTLKISTDCPISTNGALTVTLTGPQPSQVDLSGSGDFAASGLDGDSLDVTLSGSSDITLAGKVRKLTIDLSGAGAIDAINLKTKSTDLKIDGSGDAKVNASDSLDVKIAGSGSVTYRGSPAHLTQDIAGSGSINPE